MGMVVVAMTTSTGHYDNISRLLWGLMGVAMEIRCGCVPTPCGYADMLD